MGTRGKLAPGLRMKSGGANRDRTDDLHNAIVALSQLSYSPTDSSAGKARKNIGRARFRQPWVLGVERSFSGQQRGNDRRYLGSGCFEVGEDFRQADRGLAAAAGSPVGDQREAGIF